jgi:hypothetical protein
VGSSRTVFVSYRRHVSWAPANLVYKDLEKHGFDAFMDFRNLDSGEFDRVILRQIETRLHFVVVLVPGSLDRIGQEGDWLRREIAHALAHDRNVVPVTADGFKFRDVVLPHDVARLPKFNAVDIPRGYFESAMERLRTQFLKQPSALAIGSDATLIASSPRLSHPSSSWFRWTEVPGATRYVLEGSDDSDFRSSRVVYEGSSTTYSGWGRPLMRYHRVRAICRRGDSGWSNIVRATR